MFVTTNIVTLSGMMLYSTISSMTRQSDLIESLESGFPLEERLQSGDDKYIKRPIEVQPKSPEKATLSVEKVQNPFSDVLAQEDFRTEESQAKIDLSTTNSYFVKMTLFYLFYSFHVYKVSLQKDSEVNNETLKTLLSKLSDMNSVVMEMGCDDFYSTWKMEFRILLKNLNNSQQFHLPTPSSFPIELRETFQKLDSNPMVNHSDFFAFYESIDDISEKQLLQQWYFDNCKNFKKVNNYSNEKIYGQMVFDSSQWNEKLFEKYLKVIFKPNSSIFRSFFNNNYVNGIPSVSLVTILEVLKGLITCKLEWKNDHIVRVVSLLRRNSMFCGKKRGIRILIPTEDKEPLLEEILTPTIKKKAYSVMAKDPVALKLLSNIGKITQ